jgi:hypothetical protein
MELGLNAEKILKGEGCNVTAKQIDISNSESIAAFASQVVIRLYLTSLSLHQAIDPYLVFLNLNSNPRSKVNTVPSTCWCNPVQVLLHPL